MSIAPWQDTPSPLDFIALRGKIKRFSDVARKPAVTEVPRGLLQNRGIRRVWSLYQAGVTTAPKLTDLAAKLADWLELQRGHSVDLQESLLPSLITIATPIS